MHEAFNDNVYMIVGFCCQAQHMCKIYIKTSKTMAQVYMSPFSFSWFVWFVFRHALMVPGASVPLVSGFSGSGMNEGGPWDIAHHRLSYPRFGSLAAPCFVEKNFILNNMNHELFSNSRESFAQK